MVLREGVRDENRQGSASSVKGTFITGKLKLGREQTYAITGKIKLVCKTGRVLQLYSLPAKIICREMQRSDVKKSVQFHIFIQRPVFCQGEVCEKPSFQERESLVG